MFRNLQAFFQACLAHLGPEFCSYHSCSAAVSLILHGVLEHWRTQERWGSPGFIAVGMQHRCFGDIWNPESQEDSAWPGLFPVTAVYRGVRESTPFPKKVNVMLTA